METFNNDDVRNAIDHICERLSIEVDETLLNEYSNGLHPTLLSYEKVEKAKKVIPTIQKYLIGASSYLQQPSFYYDIFRSCRHVIFIQHLSRAIKVLDGKTDYLDERLGILKKETGYEKMEATMFEILVAAAYYRNKHVSMVSFISEKQREKQTPDLKVILLGQEFYIECKKFNRTNDYSSEIRDEINNKLMLLRQLFRDQNISTLIELEFFVDPVNVDVRTIINMSMESYKKNKYIRNKYISVKTHRLPPIKFKDPILFPSSKYFWDRYSYEPQSKWQGICFAKLPHTIYQDEDNNFYYKTWIEEIEWECAIKWRISNDEILAKKRRINYNRIFKAFSQLKSYGAFTIVHCWFERESALGIRQNELNHFFLKMGKSKKDIFTWLNFNETVLTVSPKGYFDVIEHIHMVSGPSSSGAPSIVTNIFTPNEETESEIAEFGIGREMPNIDDVFDSDKKPGNSSDENPGNN